MERGGRIFLLWMMTRKDRGETRDTTVKNLEYERGIVKNEVHKRKIQIETVKKIKREKGVQK